MTGIKYDGKYLTHWNVLFFILDIAIDSWDKLTLAVISALIALYLEEIHRLGGHLELGPALVYLSIYVLFGCIKSFLLLIRKNRFRLTTSKR